jgi:hypothetical protein
MGMSPAVAGPLGTTCKHIAELRTAANQNRNDLYQRNLWDIALEMVQKLVEIETARRSYNRPPCILF